MESTGKMDHWKHRRKPSDPRCDHVKNLPEDGMSNGSWVLVGRRWSCQFCGRFYGYEPPEHLKAKRKKHGS